MSLRAPPADAPACVCEQVPTVLASRDQRCLPFKLSAVHGAWRIRAHRSYILFGGTEKSGGNKVHMVQFRKGGIELVPVSNAGKTFFNMVRAASCARLPVPDAQHQ